jgi:hypothetical protein
LQAACLALAAVSAAAGGGTPVQSTPGLPPGATRCDARIPLAIELVPLTEPRVGATARFAVEVESRLDPDAVRDLRVEYEISPGLRLEVDDRPRRPARLALRGRNRLELGLGVPDERRHVVRARVVADLAGGGSVAQTAVRWIDLGDEDAPEGYLGRVTTVEGQGIRVYQGGRN